MSAPPLPFEQAFRDGMAQVSEALSHTPEVAREETKQVLDSEEFVTRVSNVLERDFRKKYYRPLVIAFGVLVTIAVVAVTIAFNQLSGLTASDTDQDAAIQRSELLISTFQDQLNQANEQLAAQGLPTIDAPVNPAPGTPEQAQLINAAAVASTLSSLPQEVLVQADPAEVARAAARAVADYMATNPVVVSPDIVISAVADYFAANQEQLRGLQGVPGLDGIDGAPGPPGPPPSADEIRAAFRDEIAANPNLLCPLGGTYSERQVALAGGGSVSQFGCFGADVGPPDDGGGGGAVDPGTGEDEPGNTGGGGAVSPPADDDEDGGSEGDVQAPSAPGPEVPTTTPQTPAPPSEDGGLLDGLLGAG